MVQMVGLAAFIIVAACMALIALGMLAFGIAADNMERMEDEG